MNSWTNIHVSTFSWFVKARLKICSTWFVTNKRKMKQRQRDAAFRSFAHLPAPRRPPQDQRRYFLGVQKRPEECLLTYNFVLAKVFLQRVRSQCFRQRLVQSQQTPSRHTLRCLRCVLVWYGDLGIGTCSSGFNVARQITFQSLASSNCSGLFTWHNPTFVAWNGSLALVGLKQGKDGSLGGRACLSFVDSRESGIWLRSNAGLL